MKRLKDSNRVRKSQGKKTPHETSEIMSLKELLPLQKHKTNSHIRLKVEIIIC